MSNRPNEQGPPRLTRQQSVQKLEENQQGIGIGLNCCTLPAAVAALVIASNCDWDNSECNDGTSYTIDPIDFLYVAGGIQVGFAGLYFLGQCCKAEKCLKSLTSLTMCMSLFYFIWAIIGLVMYNEQMSSECQSEDIAIMILAWSVIDIAIRGLACCCMIFFLCCAGMVMALDDGSGTRGRREQDPLLSSV
mmetsp:Transcript_16395/g.14695  ORF Transcript_16395/g.14695 Transcript_16395/m.14695 type:complete len:191 (-) Transcript_16395:451-1023(-)